VDCKSFDEQVVRRDAKVRDLMDKFVCVRLVQANAMDLALFQFDYDMTFAVFFLNADQTIYGRFGSRSDRKEATRDISLEGFRAALAGALELHKRYPANKASLVGKRGPAPRFKVPEEFPSLTGKYKATLDYEGKVARSCMHCHQVRDAERALFRSERKAMPDAVLYPWPMPDLVGLSLDPQAKAKVTGVAPDSAAEKAGFKVGDEISTLEGQPIISTADVQWVLHSATLPAKLKAEVRRKGRKQSLTLGLDKDWRRQSDISWRTSSWDLRRMAAGGLVLEDLPQTERQNAKLAQGDLALRVKYVGQYGEHAAGKKAGFQKEDVIVVLDGQSKRMTESEMMGYLLKNKMPAEQISMTVLRGGERLDLVLPMQ
jgi:serine protease Do